LAQAGQTFEEIVEERTGLGTTTANANTSNFKEAA
jgi:hypothetical protein